MKLFKQINALRTFLHDKRLNTAKNIGFVPTMGALHEGHLSLIKASLAENDLTICSIFVNPTQFNNSEDLEKYPRPIEKDIELLVETGCDVLFYPEVSEMYVENEKTRIEDYGRVTQGLEGHFRPGHFNGVIGIVKKLFDITEPTRVYFGQKDFQQCAVVSHMIKENNLPLEMRICPTQRESDGLAMSSRNTRLTAVEREAAKVIPSVLFDMKLRVSQQSVDELKSEALKRLMVSPLIKVEYLEIVDSITLEPVTSIGEDRKVVALIAAWCGNVRLIDNLILND